MQSPRLSGFVFAALLAGSVLNLAAGVRRPVVERAILAGNHYAAADRAAASVEKLLPPGAPLALVVYDDDLLGELDCAIWADYRFKWLLYPRKFEVYRRTAGDALQPDARYVETSGLSPRPPAAGSYLLFFRVTAPPELLARPLELVATGENWTLARLTGED